MDYLVTGGAGFIGSNIVRRLVADGVTVRVLDDLSTGRAANLDGLLNRVEWVRGDLRDDTAVRRAVRGVRYVLHLAARISVAESVAEPVAYHETNSLGTLRLLAAAREAGAERFVLSSSAAVYGDAPAEICREDQPPEPKSPYAIQKLDGERYCRWFHETHGFAAFALRYFNVYGPRQNPRSQYGAVIPLFVDALRQGRAPTIFGDGEQTRDFVFVDDVVAANLACCRAPADAAGRAYNVASGASTSVNRLAGVIAGVLGSPLRPVYAAPRPGDVRHSRGDATRARERLGWSPRIGLDEGLRQTVGYFLEHEHEDRRPA
jgi:nucleoside-diphosphate-sugar epimerase